MQSEKIETFNMAPGIFGRDDDTAKWNKPTSDRFWGEDFRDAKDSELANVEVRNMVTGDMTSFGELAGHNYTRAAGWDYLFSGTAPNTELLKAGGSNGRCLQLYDQHQMNISAGALIGTLTGHDEDYKARWLSDVIGVQFQWTDRNTSRKNNDGLKLFSLYLVYMDSEYGIMQYSPIVEGAEWQGEYTTIGDDPTAKHWAGDVPGTPIEDVDGRTGGSGRSARKAAIDHNGRIIAYISDKSVEYVKKNNMFCVGMWICTLPSGKQGSTYDRVWDIFSFKLLTQKQHMFSSNSQMIIPPSRTMKEAMFDNQFPISYPPVV
jgi:hypothetical protein